jgi:hypothetical protein
VVRKLRILKRKAAESPPNLLRGSKVEPSARAKAASRRQRGRPLYHLDRSASARKRRDSPPTISEIRRRLSHVMSAAAVCSAALRAQRCDSDTDVGVVLQRCVSDELDRLIEEIGLPLNLTDDV